MEGIRKVQARRKVEIVNATNRHRTGGPRYQEEKDVLALAASINELTTHTRRARTAMWCALQMSSQDLPQIRTLGLPRFELGSVVMPTKPSATAAAATTTTTTTASSPEKPAEQEKGEEEAAKGDTNNNLTKESEEK